MPAELYLPDSSSSAGPSCLAITQAYQVASAASCLLMGSRNPAAAWACQELPSASPTGQAYRSPFASAIVAASCQAGVPYRAASAAGTAASSTASVATSAGACPSAAAAGPCLAVGTWATASACQAVEGSSSATAVAGRGDRQAAYYYSLGSFI